MIKSEYDSIDELVQDDIDDFDDYESAKEGYDLMLKAMSLTDIQRTMLKGSLAYLEEMLRKGLWLRLKQRKRKPDLHVLAAISSSMMTGSMVIREVSKAMK